MRLRWLIPWGMFLLVVPGFLAALLVGPRAPGDKQETYCAYNIESGTPFGLSLNCDAILLLSLARNPLKHLEPGNLRQSRPLMALPAAVLRPLFVPLTDAPKWLGLRPATDLPEYPQRFMPEMFAFGFPGFVAFALVNLALLASCFAIYLRLASGGKWSPDLPAAVLVAAVGLLLVGNDVVKAFFWSPHSQLYNLLVPLIALWAAASPAGSWRRGAAVGLLSGIGVLAYPLFAIVPVCYAGRGLIDALVERHTVPAVSAGAAGLALFVVPVAWLLFVLAYVGSFYSDSLAFNQGSWILGSLRGSTFWRDLIVYADFLLWGLRAQIAPVGIAAVLAMALYIAAIPRLRVNRSDAVLWLAAVLVAAGAFAFCALAGLNSARNAAVVLPPLVVAVGALARVSAEAAPRWMVWIAAIAATAAIYGQLIYTAVKAGPYS